MEETLAQQLSQFVPSGTEHLCAQWLVENHVQLKISAPRKTRLGDFRPSHRHFPHRISVNGDLDSLHFLVTFTHEVAHVINWDRHMRKVAPHGKEWKDIYSQLLQNLIALNVLDEKNQQGAL